MADVSGDAEVVREQEHVDRAYARLDVMRQRALVRSAEVLAQGRGGTHQARHDRDAFVRSSLHRLEQLDAAEYGLVFGRLDEKDGEVWRIGRIGVNDEDYEPLVVDWRAPVAAPFYRATPMDPLGVSRRRHVHMRGRRVVGLDDELLDASAARSGDVVLVGEAALLAAVSQPRGERMGDIVATIQREQDDVIRAPLDGVTVVQGGPGTGKTAVALHRVAYLLYANRDRIEHLGVLVVGPSARFLRYIGDVLPGLGEHAVRLARIDGLLGDDLATRRDPPAVARVKGDARMATVLGRLARAWPWRTVTEDDWDDLPETMLLRLLTDEATLRRSARDVLASRDIAVLLAHDGVASPQGDGREAAPAWSDADVALLDELHTLVARRAPRRKPGRRGDADRIEETLDALDLDLDPAMRAAARRRLRDQTDTAAAGRRQVYGHVVVDEAQELSPMQWRMLVRRCPSGSMTVVGDLDQGMRAEPLRDWADLAPLLPGRLRVFELTVNYRTPAEIMAYVEQSRERTGIRRDPPRSVRFSGRQPVIRAIGRDEVVRETAQAVRTYASAPGTLAVIAPSASVPVLAGALGEGVVCLSAREAKGLEFSTVVLVAPDDIARDDGGAALYVALTRATSDLVVLEPTRPGPEG